MRVGVFDWALPRRGWPAGQTLRWANTLCPWDARPSGGRTWHSTCVEQYRKERKEACFRCLISFGRAIPMNFNLPFLKKYFSYVEHCVPKTLHY